LRILIITPSDGCRLTAHCLASTQIFGSQHVSSTLKSLDVPRSCLSPPSLWSWLWGSTKEPDGFAVNYCKPCRLGAASTPIPLMTWSPHHPGSTFVLRRNQETVHDFVFLFLNQTLTAKTHPFAMLHSGRARLQTYFLNPNINRSKGTCCVNTQAQ
jgi:hypothetical protein